MKLILHILEHQQQICMGLLWSCSNMPCPAILLTPYSFCLPRCAGRDVLESLTNIMKL